MDWIAQILITVIPELQDKLPSGPEWAPSSADIIIAATPIVGKYLLPVFFIGALLLLVAIKEKHLNLPTAHFSMKEIKRK